MKSQDSVPLKPMFKSLSLVLFFLILSAPLALKADSIAGAEITWIELKKDTLEITATVFRNCNGKPMQAIPFTISSSCGTKTFSTTIKNKRDITPVCKGQCTPCSSGSCAFKYGFESYKMSAVVPVTEFKTKSCCVIKVSLSRRSRGSTISTGARNLPLYVEAQINICASEPVEVEWSEHRTNVVCLGRDLIQEVSIQTSHPSDSVVYSFADPLTSSSGKTTWSSGYSSDKFISFLGFPKETLAFPRGLSLDSSNGQIMLRPMKEETTIFAVKAEIYRNGTWLGTTTTDRTMVVMRCPTNNPPYLSGKNFLPPYPYNFDAEVCADGTHTLCFGITAGDKDKLDTVRLTWKTNIPGAKIRLLNPSGQRDSIQFCWTPALGDASDQPYFLDVTATDNGCPVVTSSTRKYRIYAKPAPEAEMAHFSASCGDVELKAKRLSQQPVTNYLWEYKNQSYPKKSNQLRDSQSISLVGSSPHVARLTVFGKNGCTYSLTDTIIPQSSFLNILRTPDTLVCEGSVVSLNARVLNASGKFKVKWSTNDSSTNLVSTSSIKVGKQDTFVVLQLKDNKCTKTDTIKIKVNPFPKIVFDSLAPICYGDSTWIKTSNPKKYDIVNYSWYINKQLISKSPSDSSIRVDTEGTYLVKTEDRIGCTSVDSIYLDVKQPIDRNNFVRNVCKGTPTTIRLTPTQDGFYSWYLGSVDTSKSPQFVDRDSITSIFTNGQLIGVLFTDTAQGVTCKSLDSLKIEEFKPPLHIITQSKDSLCQNDTLELTSNISGGYWSYESQVKWTDNLKFTVSTLGANNATYFYQDTHGCNHQEDVSYFVGTLPKPAFILSDSVKKGAFFKPDIIQDFNNEFEYIWSVGTPSFINSKAYNPSMRIDSLGLFDVSLTVKNTLVDCKAPNFSKKLRVYMPVGLPSIEYGLKVFPNPSNGLLHVKTELEGPLSYEVYSNTGQLIQSGRLPLDGFIQLSHAKEGIYILQLTNTAKVIRETLIITPFE